MTFCITWACFHERVFVPECMMHANSAVQYPESLSVFKVPIFTKIKLYILMYSSVSLQKNKLVH